MAPRTRHPKIQQNDLEVSGLNSDLEEFPTWERELISATLESILSNDLTPTPETIPNANQA